MFVILEGIKTTLNYGSLTVLWKKSQDVELDLKELRREETIEQGKENAVWAQTAVSRTILAEV